MGDKIIDRYVFKVNNIKVIWTNDLFPFNEKYFKKLIKELVSLYPRFFENVKIIDLTSLSKVNNVFYIDGQPSIYIKEGLFCNTKQVKEPEEDVLKDDLKINTVKRRLRKTNSLKSEFIDCTQQFKHEKPYMWSILKDLNPIIYNFKNDSFYLFFELDYKNINEKRKEFLNKFQDLFSKTNYKIISSEYKNNSLFLFLSK